MNIKSLSQLNDKDKKEYIEKEYETQSYIQIAKQLGTYARKVERLAKKLGIEPKSQSDSAKLAYKNNTRVSPTQGKKRPEHLRKQIGDKLSNRWDNISKKDKIKRAEQSREWWNNRTDKQKEVMESNRRKKLKKALSKGSKMEIELTKLLRKEGLIIEQHKRNKIVNQDVHLDLYLSRENLAIEVDGPSHSQQIWDNHSLRRQKNTDSQKEALLLSSGISLIRVAHTHNFSPTRARKVSRQIIQIINNIKEQYDKRNISKPNIRHKGQLFHVED